MRSGCVISERPGRTLSRARPSGQAGHWRDDRIIEASSDRAFDYALAQTLVRLDRCVRRPARIRLLRRRRHRERLRDRSAAPRQSGRDGAVRTPLPAQRAGARAGMPMSPLRRSARTSSATSSSSSITCSNLLAGARTIKRAELHADFLAGYYAGTRKLQKPGYPSRCVRGRAERTQARRGGGSPAWQCWRTGRCGRARLRNCPPRAAKLCRRHADRHRLRPRPEGLTAARPKISAIPAYPRRVHEAHSRHDAVRPHHLGLPLCALIAGCMTTSPSRRPSATRSAAWRAAIKPDTDEFNGLRGSRRNRARPAHGIAPAGDHRAPASRTGPTAAIESSGHGGRRPKMVPRRGLEPPRLAALVPETSASTNSATWAGH